MKSKEVPTKFLWVDLEMTGVSPDKDRILEVAAIVTDPKLKELTSYQSQVVHDLKTVRKLIAANLFWAARPAAAKLMIQAMLKGKPEKEVEQDLLTLIEKFYLPSEPVYLAGNSIWNDRRFIDQWMPQLSKRLHYRMLDVTAFKLWWTAGGSEEFKKSEKHRALEDLRESIAELSHYTKHWKPFDGSPKG